MHLIDLAELCKKRLIYCDYSATNLSTSIQKERFVQVSSHLRNHSTRLYSAWQATLNPGFKQVYKSGTWY